MTTITKSAISSMRKSNMTKEQFKRTVDKEVYNKIQWYLVPEK